MIARVLGAAVLAIALGGSELCAQRPFRSGFWLENGVGTGTIRVGCGTCEEPLAGYGQSSYLRAGGTVSPRVVLGIELFALLDDAFPVPDSDSTLMVENVSIAPVVLWYPWESGLFFKWGVGLAHGEILVTGEDGEPLTLASGTGSGITFGVGLDTPIFSWLSITTNFGVYYTALGDVSVPGLYIDDVITTMYNANFAITIR